MPVIAIDGPAASGKGTLARKLASHLDYAHLDTGALYRAVGLAVLHAGGDPACESDALAAVPKLAQMDLDSEDLRNESTGKAASEVAAHNGLRQALLEFQRNFAAMPPQGQAGAVLDGPAEKRGPDNLAGSDPGTHDRDAHDGAARCRALTRHNLATLPVRHAS